MIAETIVRAFKSVLLENGVLLAIQKLFHTHLLNYELFFNTLRLLKRIIVRLLFKPIYSFKCLDFEKFIPSGYRNLY